MRPKFEWILLAIFFAIGIGYWSLFIYVIAEIIDEFI